MIEHLFLEIHASSILDAASPQAARIRQLTVKFIIAASAILLLVAIMNAVLPDRGNHSPDTF